ncbi:MAG: MFS transporter [Caldilineaceae bacterium]|nr:MFS transporter [Caldilineaceae bacterium]
MIPSIVPTGQLVRANSFILVSNQITLAIAYTAGGWLVLFMSLRQIALGVALLFGLAILCALLIAVPRRREVEGGSAHDPFWISLLSGWQYLRQHPHRPALDGHGDDRKPAQWHLDRGVDAGLYCASLAGDSADWGYQVTSYFAGMIVGSLAALAMSDWLGRSPGRIIVMNAFAAGILTLAYANSQTVWAAVVLAFLFGPPFALRDVAQDSLLQATVEDGQLGRVYATREMLRSAVFLVAGIFFAWLSDYVPVYTIYIAGGLIYLLTGFYALNNKALRESRMDAPAIAPSASERSVEIPPEMSA